MTFVLGLEDQCLSVRPTSQNLVPDNGLEPPTSVLSGLRSSQDELIGVGAECRISTYGFLFVGEAL